MPSVFSIENINLNGGVLTTESGFLYLNGNRIYFESGLPTKDNLFIKGYAPLTFYSRVPIHGTYLNEIFLNEEFIATGWLVTCSQPGTGTQSLQGRFYSRKPSSVIETQLIDFFSLETNKIFKYANPFFYKILPNQVIGLDIFSIPFEMESISINLFGYFAGAGHFDKVPKVVNFYERDSLRSGLNIYEEYIQYETTFTGIGIFANQSGAGPSKFDNQNITGYVSGALDQFPIYSQITGTSGASGYFVSGQKYTFPIGNLFSGFSGQTGFDPYWGFNYTGFEISRSGDNIFSGYFGTSRFGYGELFEPIGNRNYTVQEKIIGFRSGILNADYAFSGITGGFDDLSGYFLSGQRYYFATGTGFKAFSGMSGFDDYLGYIYTGFSFPEGAIFSGITPPTGTGIITGFIGHRNIITGENVSGFIKVFSDVDFKILTGYNLVSGYYIDNLKIGFDSGIAFSGFDGQSGFYKQWYYEYNGFFPTQSGFSGLNFANSGTGIMTGLIGFRNIPYFGPMSGAFYYKNSTGEKNIFQNFELNSGETLYSNTGIYTKIANNKRVGIDIYNTLSGLSEINISLMGFYD